MGNSSFYSTTGAEPPEAPTVLTDTGDGAKSSLYATQGVDVEHAPSEFQQLAAEAEASAAAAADSEAAAATSEANAAATLAAAALKANNLSDLTNAATARTNLGAAAASHTHTPAEAGAAPAVHTHPLADITDAGTAAAANIGTSGATVPLLDAANTFSGANTFTGANTFDGANTTTIGDLDTDYIFADEMEATDAFIETLTVSTLTGSWINVDANIELGLNSGGTLYAYGDLETEGSLIGFDGQINGELQVEGDVTLGNAAGSHFHRFFGDVNVEVSSGTNTANVVLEYGYVDAENYMLTNGPIAGAMVPGGRLSLSATDPVPVADLAGGTIYYLPFQSAALPVFYPFDSNWKPYLVPNTGLSCALTGTSAVAFGVHDVFAFQDTGNPKIGIGPAWSSTTSRGAGVGTTEITRSTTFFGRWVNAQSITLQYGASSSVVAAGQALYLGTIQLEALNQVRDSAFRRHVWNAYNRVRRRHQGQTETADTWTYTTAAFRLANNNFFNSVEFLRGLDEEMMSVDAYGAASNTSAGVLVAVGLGLDSTTVQAPGVLNAVVDTNVVSRIVRPSAHWKGHPGIGAHTINMLEHSAATGTTTWRGDAGTPLVTQCGIHGESWA